MVFYTARNVSRNVWKVCQDVPMIPWQDSPTDFKQAVFYRLPGYFRTQARLRRLVLKNCNAYLGLSETTFRQWHASL